MNYDKIKGLLEFDTPTVSNGLELLNAIDPTLGYTGPAIRTLNPELGRRVGVAVTARMDTTTAGTEEVPSAFVDWMDMVAKASKGPNGETIPVFCVIECVGPRPEFTVTIGDGMGTIMKMAGCEGFLTNGCIRDIDGVTAVPLACWGAGLSPMHGRIRWLDIGCTVVIDGATIRPGDFIHADVNGAQVLPKEVADKVYDKAASVHGKEAAFFANLRAPGMTIEKWLASRRA